jgi:hypothetical protein
MTVGEVEFQVFVYFLSFKTNSDLKQNLRSNYQMCVYLILEVHCGNDFLGTGTKQMSLERVNECFTVNKLARA